MKCKPCLLFFLLLCLVCSCRSSRTTTEVTVPERSVSIQHDTVKCTRDSIVYKTDTVRTSSVVHDSVYITHYVDQRQKGDTFFIYTRDTLYRLQIVHDTIRAKSTDKASTLKSDTVIVNNTDTIPQEITITKVEKEKYVPLLYKILSAIGGLVTIGGIAAIIVKLKNG